MTGLPEQAARTTGTVAVAKWGRVTMISPRATDRGYPWLDTLAHEMTHLALSRGTRDKAPLWLQEGVAKREETRWRIEEPLDDVPAIDAVAAVGIEKGLGRRSTSSARRSPCAPDRRASAGRLRRSAELRPLLHQGESGDDALPGSRSAASAPVKARTSSSRRSAKRADSISWAGTRSGAATSRASRTSSRPTSRLPASSRSSARCRAECASASSSTTAAATPPPSSSTRRRTSSPPSTPPSAPSSARRSPPPAIATRPPPSSPSPRTCTVSSAAGGRSTDSSPKTRLMRRAPSASASRSTRWIRLSLARRRSCPSSRRIRSSPRSARRRDGSRSGTGLSLPRPAAPLTMVFDIRFVAVDPGPLVRVGVGEIQIGSLREGFEADLSPWDVNAY